MSCSVGIPSVSVHKLIEPLTKLKEKFARFSLQEFVEVSELKCYS